jgi:hypothetical protein
MAVILTIATMLSLYTLSATLKAHSGRHPTFRSEAKRASFLERALRHHVYVCRNGKRDAKRWHCAARDWTRRELHEIRPPVPVTEQAIRRAVNDNCLEEIIDRETAGTWDPTVYNYEGSGAYGLPQAQPADKMASAGDDWRTNPLTQIRWARRYAQERYGGTCAALAYHNATGSW